MAAVAGSIKGKPIIPNQALQTYIATDDLEEAFYICGLLNSRLISQSIENLGHQGGKSFAQPSQIKKIKLIKWDRQNPRMKKISELSKTAHQYSNNHKALNKIEREINYLTKRLYQTISS